MVQLRARRVGRKRIETMVFVKVRLNDEEKGYKATDQLAR